MANGIEDALRERAEESPRNAADTPIVQIVATVEQDLTPSDAEFTLASIRSNMLASEPVIQNVAHAATINAFVADTAPSILWEDARNIRSLFRNELQEQGHTVDQVAIQADIETSSL